MDVEWLLATRLAGVPDRRQAAVLAQAAMAAAREIVGLRAVSLAEVLRACGCVVETRALEATAGGVRATMRPSSGAYRFTIDPRPATVQGLRSREASLIGPDLVEWRLAHELGHVLFRGSDGRRLVPHSPEEEGFCDEFADAVFVELRARQAA